MNSTMKWAMVLVALLTVSVQLPHAWGQLRVQSGAKQSSIKHPKELERRIFKLTNEARQKNGLPSLDPDETLAATSRQHSDDMLKRDYFSHTSPDGKTLKDRYSDAPAKARTMGRIGENIYGGSGQNYADTKTMARVIVDGWMTSPGHRANILTPQYTHLGVGVSVQGKEIRATQNFAAERN
jgi:uncharacterized protein YkwD